MRLCERYGSPVQGPALDAAAEALSRLLPVFEARGGRLVEIPLEERVLGHFEGGAARLRGVSGRTYRRGLSVRAGDLEAALERLGDEPAAVAPLPEEIEPGGEDAGR
jgi:hypothetical protein